MYQNFLTFLVLTLTALSMSSNPSLNSWVGFVVTGVVVSMLSGLSPS